MFSKKLFLILVLVLLGLYCSNAMAVAPLGPPASNLGKGKYTIGLDYTYSQMDLRFKNGKSPGGGPSFMLDDVKTNAVFIDFARGFGENWEMFLRVGAGSVRATDSIGSTRVHMHDVDGGYALGFGTKWNFCQPSENLKIGGIFQVLWSEVKSEAKIAGNKWATETDLMEMQFAVGPEYKIRKNISLYGGAFFNIVDGDFNAERKNVPGLISYDIVGGSVLGGFVGSRIAISENASLDLEWQQTSSMNLFGLKLVFALN